MGSFINLQHLHSLTWLVCLISVLYWPGADAVSDDTRHVGREDNSLVRWTQKYHKVRLCISCGVHVNCLDIEDTLHLFCVCRDEAEMEYLKIAQDLEMYGVSYFSITVSLYFYLLKWCLLYTGWEKANLCQTQFTVRSTFHLVFWRVINTNINVFKQIIKW